MNRRTISTHSLTKRLTCGISASSVLYIISTHNLTKRLTIDACPYCRPILYFNSQPHEEADSLLHKVSLRNRISTHSLTKRLTPPPSGSQSNASYFNSQPHEEADERWTYLHDIFRYFNSQPHEEADDFSINSFTRHTTFQLTASRRG